MYRPLDIPACAAERAVRRQAWQTLWVMVGLWLSRARERRALAQLDDRALADIGLSRTAAARETAKPFWQP